MQPISPFLGRLTCQRAINTADQNTELLVANTVWNEEHARVVATQVHPGNDERPKITNVAGDEHAPVAGSKFQEALVAESFQAPLFIDRPNGVTDLAKPRSQTIQRSIPGESRMVKGRPLCSTAGLGIKRSLSSCMLTSLTATAIVT